MRSSNPPPSPSALIPDSSDLSWISWTLIPSCVRTLISLFSLKIPLAIWAEGSFRKKMISFCGYCSKQRAVVADEYSHVYVLSVMNQKQNFSPLLYFVTLGVSKVLLILLVSAYSCQICVLTIIPDEHVSGTTTSTTA